VAAVSDATVAIIGLGLIGGSLARALFASGVRVRGTTASQDDARAARAAGIETSVGADAVRTAVPGADAIIIATPVEVVARIARDVLAATPANTLIVHVAGLQSASALGLADAAASRVLGTHPLAGSHGSGFAASRADLFQGAVVSAENRARGDARVRLEQLWTRAGAARVIYRSAADHDALMAWVSHLPQLAATVLAATLAARVVAAEDAGPGLRDATRLAASPYPLWRPILAAAPDEVVAALRALEARLAAARGAIEGREWGELERLWQTAGRWRSEIQGEP
jgi:prephenate dehydrogenase